MNCKHMKVDGLHAALSFNFTNKRMTRDIVYTVNFEFNDTHLGWQKGRYIRCVAKSDVVKPEVYCTYFS